jgi:hypothetical protein
MSSQIFHRTPSGRVQKITVEEQFEPRILESFGPVTQEQIPASPATIHTHESEEKSKLDESSRDSLACTTWFEHLGEALSLLDR